MLIFTWKLSNEFHNNVNFQLNTFNNCLFSKNVSLNRDLHFLISKFIEEFSNENGRQICFEKYSVFWSSIDVSEFMFDLSPQLSMNSCLTSIHRFLWIHVWSHCTDIYEIDVSPQSTDFYFIFTENSVLRYFRYFRASVIFV